MSATSSAISKRETVRKDEPLRAVPYARPRNRNTSWTPPSSRRKNSNIRKTALERRKPSEEDVTETPWLDLLPTKVYRNMEDRMHYEVLAYIAYISPTRQENEMRESSLSFLRRVTHNMFPNSRVDTFGSCATGLALPTSDIDVCVTLPAAELSKSEIKDLLFKLARDLRRWTFVFMDVFVIHRPQIPIIALKTSERYGSFKMDIGINNPQGLRSTDFVQELLAALPALRPLALLLKGLLRHRGLAEASCSGLGGFAQVCMVVVFLEMNPYETPSSLEKTGWAPLFLY